MRETSRRRFIGASGTAMSAALVGPLVLNTETAFAMTTVVRRNVAGMDASDPILVSYRKAIRAMKALPRTNPLSWEYQAAIHGTVLTPVQTAWNTCEHGTRFFWSWHRMYLYWFERIVRKMCGDPCWALPYWSWAPGSDLKLPAPFRDTASELFTANRNPAMNDGTGSLNAGAVSIAGSFLQTDYFTTNSVVQGPHGSVHVEVGGGMGTVSTAGLDPIFYVHHSNVDRQWNLWLAQGGGRTNPVTDTAWTTRQYTFFDEAGAAVKMTACQILRAAQQLHYVYEGEPPQVLTHCLRRPPWFWEFVREALIRLPIPPVELKGEPVSFPIDLKEIRSRIVPLLESKADTVLLELDDVEAQTQPGIVWAVYVGLPAGAEPSAASPHYVGVVSLFGAGVRDEKHHGYTPAHFEFPLNVALQSALRAGSEKVDVTFVPLGILVDDKPSRPEPKAPVRIGRASLSLQTGKEVKTP
jgi:hypothetical protein